VFAGGPLGCRTAQLPGILSKQTAVPSDS
jgi:hypothetical protein